MSSRNSRLTLSPELTYTSLAPNPRPRMSSRLGVSSRQFWMSFDDFCTHFTHCVVCRVPNTTLLSLRKTWDNSTVYGDWRGAQAGGSSNHPTYLKVGTKSLSVGVTWKM